MPKITSLRSRPLEIGGVAVNPGETAWVPDSPIIDSLLRDGVITAYNVKVTETSYSRENLEKLPMGELRKIGNPLGVKDTSKSELVTEILNKVKNKE